MKPTKIPHDTPLKITYREKKYMAELVYQQSFVALVRIYNCNGHDELKDGQEIVVRIKDIEIV